MERRVTVQACRPSQPPLRMGEKKEKDMSERFDGIVIGAGPGGEVA